MFLLNSYEYTNIFADHRRTDGQMHIAFVLRSAAEGDTQVCACVSSMEEVDGRARAVAQSVLSASLRGRSAGTCPREHRL
jgi:hypothetical protein